MSRPPHYVEAQPPNRKGVIDFVGAPACYPSMEEAFYAPMQQQQNPQGLYSPYPTPGYPPMMMQAPGPQYPGVSSMYPGQEYVNSAAYYPAMPYTASPYYTPPIPQPDPASLSSSKPSITEEEIKERINAKIESIMEAQKTEMLSNQIERLTDRVQKLSRNIEAPSRYSPGDSARGEASLSSSYGDDNISQRLKQLASESMKKAQPRGSGRKLPDW